MQRCDVYLMLQCGPHVLLPTLSSEFWFYRSDLTNETLPSLHSWLLLPSPSLNLSHPPSFYQPRGGRRGTQFSWPIKPIFGVNPSSSNSGCYKITNTPCIPIFFSSSPTTVVVHLPSPVQSPQAGVKDRRCGGGRVFRAEGCRR